jgi:hypothetical protein
MIAGELYDSSDAQLTQMRIEAKALMNVYNQTPYNKPQREMY